MMRVPYSEHYASRRRSFGPANGTGKVRPRSTPGPLMPYLLMPLLFLVVFLSPAAAATPSGTLISNTALATYTSATGGGTVSVPSNTITVLTTALTPSAVIELLTYAPYLSTAESVTVRATSYSAGGTASGPFITEPNPVPLGSPGPLSLASFLPLTVSRLYHAGDPVFIRLTARYLNADPSTAETVLVTITNSGTGDTELLMLTETGPNTGVFVGYVPTNAQPALNHNGILNVSSESTLQATYSDAANALITQAAGMIDPSGIVFSSATGQAINGATVSLIDTSTNAPAAVFGDDGVSAYPATVTTGGSAQDGSGKSYSFPSGGYRFPYLKPGTYRLYVIPPTGYRAPSHVPESVLQTLPGAPFSIATPGSWNDAFVLNPGPAVRIDVPADPTGATLYLIKAADKQTAAAGDFIPYRLTVENLDAANTAPAVSITDRLPHALRYRKGSARLNKAVLADPAISADGRTLTFGIGDLAASATAQISYVAEVGAGTPLGPAANSAVAAATSGARSNTATATVQIIEDLFRSKTTIVGRVLDGCGPTASGLAGVRIYLEDGTYVVTDKQGMYHFAQVNPGTHVVQLDTTTLPAGFDPELCEDNTRFAGAAFSQFVDLQGGSLWRADFHAKTGSREPVKPKEKPRGSVSFELMHALASRASESRQSDVISYSVPVRVDAVAAENLRLIVLLPDGVAYRSNSSRLNDAALVEPQIMEGVLTYRLGDRPAAWQGAVSFEGEVPRAGNDGELVTKAYLMFNAPEAKGMKTALADVSLVRQQGQKRWVSPEVVLRPRFENLKAALSAGDQQEIARIIEQLKKTEIHHITVTGHTDSNRIAPGASKEFPDNYALSLGRAKTVAAMISTALQLTPDQVTVVGKGPDEPVADNKTAAGRALNRRVELTVEEQRASFWHEIRNHKERSGVLSAETTGSSAGTTAPPAPAAQTTPLPNPPADMPSYTAEWIESAAAGAEWLWPADGYHPKIASTSIAVKHDPLLKPKLLLNGREVEAVFFEGTLKKSDGSTAVSVWRGIHLQEGDNQVELSLLDASDSVAARMQRNIHYSGPIVKTVLVPERSQLVADGKNPVVVAIRLLDKDGHPARESVRGEYTIDAPYQPKQRDDWLQTSPLAAPDANRYRYVIEQDGIAKIELNPTVQTGEAVLHFTLADRTQELRAWVQPDKRDWILVGLAEGTVGYNVITGNMETSAASAAQDNLYENDRVAFFAKGTVKGEWLLTMAYDSKKNAGNRPGLYQTIDPNQYYTLYGDATDQRAEAASAKKIYIKLERNQFYALFGDYNTGLSITELSRYNRNMTGFKSEMKSERFNYTVFASEADQAHVRDEIPGDGTSGLYHLSRKNIQLNSDTVTIETRDRFKSEVIVSSRQLTRYVDYTLDPEAGTIFFKAPVYSRDENFNPVFIIAEYEILETSNAYNAGGRGAVQFLDNRAEVGATIVHEGRAGGSGDLEGLDAKIKLADATTLKTEIASTKSESTGTVQRSAAYLVEVQHRTDTLEGRAYAREEQVGFGLGQQNVSESGTRKVGADVNYHLTKPWTIGGEAFRQELISTGAVQEMEELRTRYAFGAYDVLVGIRHAENQQIAGATDQSNQLFAGLTYRINDRTSVRIRHDQSVGSNADVEFPTRTTVGADYKLNDQATMYADQEWTRGSFASTDTTRFGVKASPWTGGQIGSSVEQQTTENGVRLFSTNGLKQTWQIDKKWSVDAGLDRSDTLRTSQTYTSSGPLSEDFTAVSFGVGFREEKWSWVARAENRVSASEHKLGLYSGVNGEVRNGLALAAALQNYRTQSDSGSEQLKTDLRLSLAHRPFETRVIILDRLDYQVDEQRDPLAANYRSRRIINNFVANILADARTQVSLQYGAKYVLETIDATDYSGYTDLLGIEGRYDLSKMWDVGVRGQRLCTWSLHQEQYGIGASTGFHAGRNVWISIGYNFEGFKDRDFSRSDFTSAGPFIKMRLKFDQVSVRDAVNWFSGH